MENNDFVLNAVKKAIEDREDNREIPVGRVERIIGAMLLDPKYYGNYDLLVDFGEELIKRCTLWIETGVAN